MRDEQPNSRFHALGQWVQYVGPHYLIPPGQVIGMRCVNGTNWYWVAIPLLATRGCRDWRHFPNYDLSPVLELWKKQFSFVCLEECDLFTWDYPRYQA